MKAQDQRNRPSSWLPFDSPKFGVGKIWESTSIVYFLKICCRIFVANVINMSQLLAIYNFDDNGPFRLPLVLGETVKIVEECQGLCFEISLLKYLMICGHDHAGKH